MNTLSPAQAATVLADKIAVAVAQNAGYSQYEGYFDFDGLARVVSTKGLRPRGRKQWPVGSLANGRMAVSYPAIYSPVGEAPTTDVVLFAPGYGNCRLPAHCIEWVIAPR